MVIVKIKENEEDTENGKIRRHFDVTSQKWYFSIVDVIGALTHSTDARNYWKVLKNRLKKKDPDLVTKCNQLKMKAKDGKSYLTDVANSPTMMHIIESIPKASVEAFKVLIGEVDEIAHSSPVLNTPIESIKINTPGTVEGGIPLKAMEPEETFEEPETEAQLLIDGYQTSTAIIIKTFVAGVDPNLLNIHVGRKKIIIQGQRSPEKIQDNYINKELYWPTFSRTISLPSSVEKDSVKVSEYNGLVTIELQKSSNT